MSSLQIEDVFGARAQLETAAGTVVLYRLDALAQRGIGHVDRLPFSIKVLLECALRNIDNRLVREQDVTGLACWQADSPGNAEVPFKPARVILQDFTGVPAVVDLAAMRDAMVALGADPKKINPQLPVDLVIDHSVQVDRFASADALSINAEIEFERNRRRYEFLRWGQSAFDNFSVVPPATGIVHQVNLEYLASAVATTRINGRTIAIPDTLVGTDSHTTMINGLGVVGWGVGGIEAEAVMLGQPIYMVTPEVVGFRLTGTMREGTTATDLVLTITRMLREHGVVGKFVEFYGSGLSNMTLPDRATVANMAPEYGATMGFFPIDDETLRFLRRTGRPDERVDLVERYAKEQGLFRTDQTPDPHFTTTVQLDISTVEPSLAGPKRPQDRIALSAMKSAFRDALRAPVQRRGYGLTDEQRTRTAVLGPIESTHDARGNEQTAARRDGQTLHHGSVVIAAITSCTNTSNPSVMLAAGILAKKAVEAGLDVKPYVKTSLAPGSRVVTAYLDDAGLTPYLEKLGFHTVAYGCTTCIGNSGPLPDAVTDAIRREDLIVSAVLSGNRNFEGRVSPIVKANYLASPPLVVAYAIAGTVDIDLTSEPLGRDQQGNPVYLKDIWPAHAEINDAMARCVTSAQFTAQYANVWDGNERWNAVHASAGDTYAWRDDDTYINNPPFFEGLTRDPQPVTPITGARVLVMLGDSITTDHISPAGVIQPESPAGLYLQSKGVAPNDFNSYGSRRGNDEVMTRGTFANVRLRNLLVPGSEGGLTVHMPSNERMSVYDAAMRYRRDGTPLIVLAGAEYGTGSSRDWAAKGTRLLGVRAVLAVSFERIHRSNLLGMGVLPLQFTSGDTCESLGLTGRETFDVDLDDALKPGHKLPVVATDPDGAEKTFTVTARLDTPIEVDYYRHGGILHMVLRNLAT